MKNEKVVVIGSGSLSSFLSRVAVSEGTLPVMNQASSGTTLDQDVAALTAAVQPETDASDAIEALLTNVSSLYQAAVANATDVASAKAAVEAVTAKLTANTAKIVAATVANTPAAAPGS